MASQISKDPLGIGVLMGYLALKENEVSNIRWIAYGISMEMSPAAIQAELEYIQ
jgi:vacuolar-type H+-ATPase subunit C/Vma6